MDSQTENLVIQSETVVFKNGEGNASLAVRGLGLAQIIQVVRRHRDLLDELYQQAVTGALSLEDAGAIAFELIERSMPLAMDIADAGMGRLETPLAATLPATVQLAVIEKTITLTLAAEGGLGNLMEIVIRAMKATQGLNLTSLREA